MEVNLSPACAERASFLRKMVDDMTYNMFKIIFKDDLIFPDDEEKDGEVIENSWELIYDNSEEY